ncbi:hypothetical protein [Pelosinus baikalensis]|uniref:Uncharacterized protein n=1 Tax=Pelosinus baikalensis TaxID=2892015 RepID=A0ABS8HKS3_9FIRM|nr:hypothetical protein [Pelosinus baikalensis]MCC5463785.1 hypothetical protein [Pelosinus baikalensis]
MGFTLSVEKNDTLFFGEDIISFIHIVLNAPSNSRAKSTNNYITMNVVGKLHADDGNGSNSETIKLFQWAQIPAENEEAYRSVTAEVIASGKCFRKITFNQAFVVDYSERYTDTKGIGEFAMTIRQKIDKIDEVEVDGGLPIGDGASAAVAAAAAGTSGDFVSTGSQAGGAGGVMNNIGRAAVTAALNKVDPSGTAAIVAQAGLDKK